MGSQFIPKYGDIRNANDYRLQNTIFSDNGKLYKYVKIAVGTYIREYSALCVNGEGEATIPADPRVEHNAVAEFAIDAMGEAKWARVIWIGDAAVDVAGKDISCVYNNTKLVGMFNGKMRSVNANTLIGVMTAKFEGTTYSNMFFDCAAGTVANVNLRLISTGDVCTCNLSNNPYFTAVVINTNFMATTVHGAGLAMVNASSAIRVIDATSTAKRSSIATSSANYIQYKVNVPVNAINVSSAVTVFTLNAAVAGMLVKTGDLIKFSGVGMPAGADSCTLYVTGIINATAFNCNASTDVETTGAMGTIFNVCSYYYKCTVGSF